MESKLHLCIINTYSVNNHVYIQIAEVAKRRNILIQKDVDHRESNTTLTNTDVW